MICAIRNVKIIIKLRPEIHKAIMTYFGKLVAVQNKNKISVYKGRRD